MGYRLGRLNQGMSARLTKTNLASNWTSQFVYLFRLIKVELLYTSGKMDNPELSPSLPVCLLNFHVSFIKELHSRIEKALCYLNIF